MRTHAATIIWKQDREGRIHARGNPEIAVSVPSAEAPPDDGWSAAELLSGAIGTWLMGTALDRLAAAGVRPRSYMSNVTGTLTETAAGTDLARVEATISVTVGDDDHLDAARVALTRTEESCPVAKVLGCPMAVSVNLLRAEGI